jgi:nucleoside phosphorylase
MTETEINIVVALPAEAKPINQHLGLVRDNRYEQYPLYRNGPISLVISGCGVQIAAATTSWLHQTRNSRPNGVWINLGIAGHPSHAIGEAFLARSIIDQTTGDEWSLATGENLPCSSERVFSVAKPDDDYKLDGLIEMEAAGFYRSAIKCTTPDRIHCLKVVSDNCDNPTEQINGKMVTQLIRKSLDLLDKLIRAENNR